MSEAQLTHRSEQACFGGTMGFYSHPSESTGTEMRFGVYVPPQAASSPVPALYYLAGLTCTEETFFIKAGAQYLAAQLGLMLVSPDTSPRGLNLPGESDAWDLGAGAGFYLDATQEPWAPHYRMATYVDQELPALIQRLFPACPDRRGIFGHSMGGHGALVLAQRRPEYWHSVSAFAPICNPAEVPWGQKAFRHYLGAQTTSWAAWDASQLMRKRRYPGEILIDQGLSDAFLNVQLHPQALAEAARISGQALKLREHAGYDHSYWFIQSFIADHLKHHAVTLKRAAA